MPFHEDSKMQQRKRMVHRVLHEQCSVSRAAREAGVSRVTAYAWLDRARRDGLEQLAEESRRPLRSPAAVDESIVLAVLECKRQFPDFGAKKIHHRLWTSHGPAPVALRTVDRILDRNGQTRPRTPKQSAAVLRFERATCNELWQTDFKGMGKPRHCYAPLTVIDDHSRYCLSFEPLARQTQEQVWEVLWKLFGEVGMPDVLLSDNGSCFTGTWGDGPSQLECKLWLLGIRTAHGRPYHPQTQGKVERFHRTIAEALLARGVPLRQPDIASAKNAYAPALHSYNWERPHEALDMSVPGAIYVPSTRQRPESLPPHELPEGAVKRKVCSEGKISYRSHEARVGKGLCGQTVEVREVESDEKTNAEIFFTGVKVANFPLTQNRQKV